MRVLKPVPFTQFCTVRTTFSPLTLFAQVLKAILFNPVLRRYYDQDLALARDLEDRMSMGRAYCNLGLAHLAIGNMENALECQKYFLGKCILELNTPQKRDRQMLVSVRVTQVTRLRLCVYLS